MYTDLYNYSFLDAISYLSQRVGIKLELADNKKTKEENVVKKILLATSNWFIRNLSESGATLCRKYLNTTNLVFNVIISVYLLHLD